MRVLRLSSDWCLDPFYVDEGDGIFLLEDAHDVAERFDLPDDVVREVTEWDQLYQSHLNGYDPTNSQWPGPNDHRRYVERGREVARLLRRHLPADVAIEYLADGAVHEYYEDGTPSEMPMPEAERRALISEVAAVSDRIVATEVLDVARAADGRVVWLERAGLSTLLEPARIAAFTDAGIAHADVPGLPIRALVHGWRVGRVAGGSEVHALQVPGLRLLVVAVEPDGRIADAGPKRPEEELLPWDESEPLPVTVRLDPEHEASFEVREFDGGPFVTMDNGSFRDRFAVPDEVMAAVSGWTTLYQEHLNTDDPASSQWAPGALRRYHELGRRAAQLLRQHLPAHVSVLSLF